MSGEFLPVLFSVITATWPIWLPVLLGIFFLDVWTSYIQNVFRANYMKWSFLEVRIPREILKGPRIMEQLFASLHSIKSGPGDWYDYFWNGDVASSYSFEIASHGGEVHFYIRTLTKFKNMLEAAIYSFYPDVEIIEVGDYVDRMPSKTVDIYATGYNIWGSEFILAKPDAYPIRTYKEFETMDEFSMVDPIGTLIEILAKLQPEEEVWVQIIIASADTRWKEAGEKLVEELKAKTITTTSIGGDEVSSANRSPGQLAIMRSVEENIAKPGFYTTIRVLYFGKADRYNYDFARKGVLGAFNQYGSLSLNSFKHNNFIQTYTQWYMYPYFFPKWRVEYRKQHLLKRFRERRMPQGTLFGLWRTGTKTTNIEESVMVLNIEELATIYHFPTKLVLTAPMIQRLEAKKVGPPAGLAIFGEDESAVPEVPPGFTYK